MECVYRTRNTFDLRKIRMGLRMAVFSRVTATPPTLPPRTCKRTVNFDAGLPFGRRTPSSGCETVFEKHVWHKLWKVVAVGIVVFAWMASVVLANADGRAAATEKKKTKTTRKTRTVDPSRRFRRLHGNDWIISDKTLYGGVILVRVPINWLHQHVSFAGYLRSFDVIRVRQKFESSKGYMIKKR